MPLAGTYPQIRPVGHKATAIYELAQMVNRRQSVLSGQIDNPSLIVIVNRT